MKENGRCLPLSKRAMRAATFTCAISFLTNALNPQDILDFFLSDQLLIKTDAEGFYSVSLNSSCTRKSTGCYY